MPPRNALPIDELLALLRQGPERIAVATGGLSAAALATSPAPGEWSPNEVLAHLRACADQWGGSLATIVREDHPTLRAINPRAWVEQTNYPGLDFRQSLDAFANQRAGLLALLEALPPDGWERSATIKGSGKTLQRTASQYANWIAIHERPHVKQIERAARAVRP